LSKESLAMQFDGKPWRDVTPHIKTFNAVMNQYLLRDGSVVQKYYAAGLTMVRAVRVDAPISR
jgi:hypothetical protein